MTNTDQRLAAAAEQADGALPDHDHQHDHQRDHQHDQAHQHGGPASAALGWYLRTKREYETGAGQSDERPLTGYALLSTGYLVATGTAAALVARRKRGGAALPSAAELALLSVAVFRTTRTIAKDSVLTHLRAPFTVFEGSTAPGEVEESPRPGPVRHAVGELITCPFCIGQWVGTAAMVSWAAAPRATRWAATTMTAVAAADVLQYAYGALQKTEQ